MTSNAPMELILQKWTSNKLLSSFPNRVAPLLSFCQELRAQNSKLKLIVNFSKKKIPVGFPLVDGMPVRRNIGRFGNTSQDKCMTCGFQSCSQTFLFSPSKRRPTFAGPDSFVCTSTFQRKYKTKKLDKKGITLDPLVLAKGRNTSGNAETVP